MSVEELKQVVEKWKNEDGTERAVLLVTVEGCDNGESQCTDMAMIGDRERLITALQAVEQRRGCSFACHGLPSFKQLHQNEHPDYFTNKHSRKWRRSLSSSLLQPSSWLHSSSQAIWIARNMPSCSCLIQSIRR